jgi:prepilin-type N-terminal cleavage/methylation domain-containing protein
MKIPNANQFSIFDFRFSIAAKRVELSGFSIGNRQSAIGNSDAFTLIEIAISLAIIGIALVGIIGVLPMGMNTQRDTREETVINQDAAILLPIITEGAHGVDDLTNYVFAITNFQTSYMAGGVVNGSGSIGCGADYLTNGLNIVGLLSTPEYTTNSLAIPNLVSGGYSNHIVAYIRSLSGLAAEKPPQNNSIVTGDSFSYKLLVVNAPVALDTNSPVTSSYARQLFQSQREFRMTFYWPLLPNGKIGNQPPLTYRATIAGQILTNGLFANNQPLYFYHPQSFSLNTNSY